MEPFCSRCFVKASDLEAHGIADDGTKIWWFKMAEDAPVEVGLNENGQVAVFFMGNPEKNFDYNKNEDGDIICVDCATKMMSEDEF